MPTIEDLGRKIKRDYPGEYDDMSDYEVGVCVKKEYPNQYLEYSDSLVTYEPPSHTEKNIDKLWENYGPKHGGLRAKFRAWQSRHRGAHLEALTNEQLFLIQQGELLSEEIRKGRRSEVEFRVFVSQNAALLREIEIRAELAEKAFEAGMTLHAYEALLVERGQSEIRITEHERKTGIDLDNRWKEIQQDSRAADLAQLGDFLVVKKLRKELTKARRERYAVKTGSDPASLKRELLADYDKFISRLEAQIDEREARFIPSEDRQAPRGRATGASDSGADYPPEADEDDF